MTTTPNPGAVAALADTAARLVNRWNDAGQDSGGHDMVKVRKALIRELRLNLAAVYPDPRDHNLELKQALIRTNDQ